MKKEHYIYGFVDFPIFDKLILRLIWKIHGYKIRYDKLSTPTSRLRW